MKLPLAKNDRSAACLASSPWLDPGPLILYFVLALFSLMPMPRHAQTEVIQTSNDVRQHLWWQWWVKEAVTSGRSPYLTDRLLYPTGAQLYLSPMDNVAGLVSVPLQGVLGLVASYNAIVVLGVVLSGYAMFLLALEVTRSGGGAVVAGASFALFPLLSTSTNMGQLEWTNVGFIPLAILGLIRIEQGPWWALLPRALLLTLAMLVTWYHGVFLLLFAALYGAWQLSGKARLRHWKGFRALSLRLLAWLFIALALAAPLLVPTIEAGARNPGAAAPREWVALNSARPDDPFLPNALNPLYGLDRSAPSTSLGYVVLVLALLGVLHARRQAIFWVVCFAVFYLLSLGPILTWGTQRVDSYLLPYNLLYSLPLGKIARTPVRFLFLVCLAASILAAWGVASIQERLGRRSRRAAAGAAAMATALVVGEAWPAPRPVQSAVLHPFYSLLAASPPGPVLELPREAIPAAMHAQSVHGNPIVGGYVSRHAPEALRNYEIPVIRQLWIPTPDVLAELSFSDVVHQAPLQERIGEVLDAYGLRYVVLHLDASRSQEVARLKELLSSAFPPSAVLWEDERILAYRIPRMPARTGIGVGMGVDWGPVQRLPENGLQYRWSKGDANVVAMLLDASPREAILNASVLSTRKRQQVELDLNGTPRARLSLAREPQSIRLRLFLKPGYNVLRFRSVGVPSSRDDEGRFLFGLGRLSLVPEVNRGS